MDRFFNLIVGLFIGLMGSAFIANMMAAYHADTNGIGPSSEWPIFVFVCALPFICGAVGWFKR